MRSRFKDQKLVFLGIQGYKGHTLVQIYPNAIELYFLLFNRFSRGDQGVFILGLSTHRQPIISNNILHNCGS